MSKSRERIRDSQMQYKKGLGQNFIYDEDLLASLVEAAGVGSEDEVLEIGAGSGNLTRELCRRVRKVTSIELDERLLPLIRVSCEPYGNLELVQGDAMELNLEEMMGRDREISVVANIPYYITTPLLTRLLTSGLRIRHMAVMVQKEVADKMCAGPGEEGWGMLALRIRQSCDVLRVVDVPRTWFTPVPKVDSAFVVLEMREAPRVQPRSEEDFYRVAAAGFAQRRKTMANAIMATFRIEKARALEWLERAGLDEKVRGEKLTLEELCRLSDIYTQEAYHDSRQI